MEKFQVTGSIIPQAAGAIASPVTTIDPDILDKSLVTSNPMELLRKTIPQFQGNNNLGVSNANIASNSTGGGSQATLRNLTTLTLINNRRAAVSPISGTGGNQFVDLNIIPLAAIDSIDVLLDGASATYGSDATSGVINIKTKKNFNGAQVGGFYEWSPNKGHWANRGGNFVVGAGNGDTNITVAGGYSKSDPLFQYERGFSAESYGTPTFGGVINFNAVGTAGAQYFVLNPALSAPPVGTTKPTVTAASFPMATSAVPLAPGGAPYFGAIGSNAVYWGKVTNGNVTGFGAGELATPPTEEIKKVAFNLAQYVTMLQRRESRGAMITFDHKVNEAVTFFGDILASKINTFSQINAQPIGTSSTFNAPAAFPYNPFNGSVRVRNRFVSNPRQYEYDTNFARLVAGVRGDITDRISYETAVNLNKSELAYQNPGVIDSAKALAAAGLNPLATSAAGVQINLFQRNVSPADVAAANFVGTGYNNFNSVLNSWDGKIVVNAFQIQGNDVKLAVGSEYRKEALNGTADLNSIPDTYGNIGWTGATSVNPFSASRKVTAFFAEALIPVSTAKNNSPGLHLLEFDLAVRHEDYSDTDNPTVPKVAVRWLPFNDEFALRATYGRSFNAPKLYEVFGPSDVGFTPDVTLLPYGMANVSDNYVAGQAQSRSGSNPNLKPARSTAWTFGAIWSPKAIKGFSIEVDYWKIKEHDIVGQIASQAILQSVENLGPNSPYVRNLANGQPNPAYIGDRANPKSYDVRIDGFGADGTLISAPGQIANNIDSIYMTRPLVNIASQKASGVDAALKYKFDVTNVGKFQLSSNFAYWRNYTFEDEELSGRATITGGTIPRWSNYTLVDFVRGPWDAFVGNRYIPKVNAPDETGIKTVGEAYDSVDVGFGYKFGDNSPRFLRGFKVSVGVTNLTNSKPVVLPDTFSESNADIATYDPVGRRYIVKADLKF